jgi:molybdopterin-guanine dinucleotide biosynthesis protein A
VKAYIPAGGGGSRLSPGKGFLTVGGVPIVERVCAAARPLVDEIILVGPAELLEGTGLRVVTEEQPGLAGPLGGVRAALSDAGTQDALVLPWDAPFVRTEVLAYLRDVRGASDAAVPRRDDYIEPLLALYGPGCLKPATEALRRGERRVIAFYDDIAIRWVEEQELAPFGDWDALFLNVNTPADLAQARRIARSTQGDRR